MAGNEQEGRFAVLRYAGAFIAFMVGSGFATGQEVMQYYVAFGYGGFAAALLAFALLACAGVRIVAAAHRERFAPGEVYAYYCGHALGRFFDYFSTLAVYLSFVVILAGAGAILEQQCGLPRALGVLAGAALSCLTVLGGFGRMVRVIGRAGPAVIAMVLLVGAGGLIGATDGVAAAAQAAPAMDLLRAADHWPLSAVSYAGISMIWLTGFLSQMGATAPSQTAVRRGVLLGMAVFFAAVALVTAALLANLDAVRGAQAPMLALARRLHPAVAALFTAAICTGIYTASVPLLWSVTARVAPEGSGRGRLAVPLAAGLAAAAALALPFDRLVNVVYVLCGYIGFFLCLAVLWRDAAALLRRRRARRCAH